MGSKADFYIGRGPEAEWLGSIGWDGLPAGLPSGLLATATEDAFRSEVAAMLLARPDGVPPEKGWPWTWDTSLGTSYSYAFDRERVWACCFGSSWWKAVLPEPEHTTLTRKAARFPDMSIYRAGGGSLFEKPEITAKPKRTKKRSEDPSTHS